MVDKVILKSDFRDYYDHWFDKLYYPDDEEYIIFERMSNGGMSRRQMFEMFDRMGIDTPLHGTPMEILTETTWQFDTMLSKVEVVVYTDLFQHCGEGKVKMPILDAIEQYPNDFCSEYIEPVVRGESHRYLQIGNQGFWLQFNSSDDWRSNCGDVKIKIAMTGLGAYNSWPTIKEPLYAFDWVERREAECYIIDFNIAPQIKGTGIEAILSGPEAANQIKERILGGKHDRSCNSGKLDTGYCQERKPTKC